MATFLKTTEISIDGARTLPREYYTSPELFAEELEHIFTKRWLCVGREDRLPKPGRLVHPGHRQGEHHRAARSRGRATGRTTTSAATAAPGSARSTAGSSRRDHPVSLPRLDLRARRPADRRPVHRRDRGLRQGATGRCTRWPWRPGKASCSSTWPTQPEPFDQAWAPLLGRFSRFNLPNLKVARTIEYDVQVELEAAVPELLGVLPLRAGAPGAGQAHAAHQRRERPDRGPVHRRLHGDQPRRREHDHERPVVRRGGGRPARRGPQPGLLLRHLPQHAAEPAPRLRDVPHPVAAGHRPHPHHLLLALPSRHARRPDLQPGRRDRVLGHDQPAGLAHLRAEPARRRVAGLHAGTVLEAGEPVGAVRPGGAAESRAG